MIGLTSLPLYSRFEIRINGGVALLRIRGVPESDWRWMALDEVGSVKIRTLMPDLQQLDFFDSDGRNLESWSSFAFASSEVYRAFAAVGVVRRTRHLRRGQDREMYARAVKIGRTDA